MKKLLYIILLLPLWVQAQTNGTIQKTSATGTIRGSFGSLGLDTLPRVTGALVDGYILKYHAATNKWYASPDIASTLGTSAISLGGTANGLSYSAGNYRLHKVTATTGGVLTTGTDTIGGAKIFTNSVDGEALQTIVNANTGVNAYTRSVVSNGTDIAGIQIAGVNKTDGTLGIGGEALFFGTKGIVYTASANGHTFVTGGSSRFSINSAGAITANSLSAGGLIKSASGVLGIATAGTDYLTPTGSGSGLSGVMLLTTNQSASGVKTFTDQIVSTTTSASSAIAASSTNAGGRVITALGNSTLEPLSVTQQGSGMLAAFTTTDGVTSTDKVLIRNNGSIYTKGQLEVSNLLVGDAADSVMVHRYLDNTVRRVGTTGTGSAVFSNAPSFTSATFSGDLSVGTVTPYTLTNYKFITVSAVTGAGMSMQKAGVAKGTVYTANDDLYIDAVGNQVFQTGGVTGAGTERGRFTTGGYFKASNNGTYLGVSGSYHELSSNTNSQNILVLTHTGNTTPYGILLDHTTVTNNSTNYFFYAREGGAQRFQVYTNGGIANYSANNVNLSDERTKKNIVKAGSYWNIIKSIEFDNYKYKDQTDSRTLLGVMAQQVESVYPEWVSNSGSFGKASDGSNYKSVYEQQLQYGVNIVVQESMKRIEALEAEIKILKQK